MLDNAQFLSFIHIRTKDETIEWLGQLSLHFLFFNEK